MCMVSVPSPVFDARWSTERLSKPQCESSLLEQPSTRCKEQSPLFLRTFLVKNRYVIRIMVESVLYEKVPPFRCNRRVNVPVRSLFILRQSSEETSFLFPPLIGLPPFPCFDRASDSWGRYRIRTYLSPSAETLPLLSDGQGPRRLRPEFAGVRQFSPVESLTRPSKRRSNNYQPHDGFWL